MQQPWLWARIVDYEFPRGFEGKLCEQLGCKATIAAKLREEYRRFVYLAMVSSNEATPSESIDRVWHLHLCYTRDYWETFCHDVLQCEFHHDPCDGPESRPRYNEQYAATLALYEQEFGSPAPSKVWPTKATSKSIWTFSGSAVIGFVISFWAVLSDGPDRTTLLSIGLLLMFFGVVFSVLKAPYGQSSGSNGGRRMTGGEGGGSGNSAGCGGGGGCGGSGGG